MRYLVLGAGMMGKAAAYDLANSENVDKVLVTDIEEKRAKDVADFIGGKKVDYQSLDVSNYNSVVDIMKDYDAAISCVTYRFNYDLARAAIETKTHFCDLGGNNSIVEKELSLDAEAKKAGVTIIPDCGLAPGLVSILSADALTRFDTLDSLMLRVGGLPQNPKPPLNYKIVFSPTGLINEYKEDCVRIREGKVETIPSMVDLEEIEFPEPFGMLEAFNTSGGTSTLPKTMIDKVKNLDYKTIRYKGHCEIIKMMLDIGLADEKELSLENISVKPRDVLEEVLKNKLTNDDEDLILLRVVAKGIKDLKEKTVKYDVIDYHDEANNITAMMRMTAFPASIIAQMMASGEINKKGAVPQELCVPTKKFIEELRKRNIDLTIQ